MCVGQLCRSRAGIYCAEFCMSSLRNYRKGFPWVMQPKAAEQMLGLLAGSKPTNTLLILKKNCGCNKAAKVSYATLLASGWSKKSMPLWSTLRNMSHGLGSLNEIAQKKAGKWKEAGHKRSQLLRRMMPLGIDQKCIYCSQCMSTLVLGSHHTVYRWPVSWRTKGPKDSRPVAAALLASESPDRPS